MARIELPDVPVADTVDEPVAMALRQLITNLQSLVVDIETEEITFDSEDDGTGPPPAAVTILVPHRLGRRPSKWRVINKLYISATSDIYVTQTDKGAWTDRMVQFTTTLAGTTFTVEVY